MTTHKTATWDAWLEARRDLLAAEKDLTRRSDQVAQLRRQLPWVRVDKAYTFDGPDGRQTLAGLFNGRRQLMVQHFMLTPGAEQGCPSCSFMADHTDGITVHLAHRDVTFVAISRAPFAEIERFRRRMGWQFKWLSSHGSSFNYDFRVSFTPEEEWPKVSFPTITAPGLMRSRNGPESACSGRTMRAMSFTPIRPMDVAWR
jgi:predicted dithiol-disulfide oxidoreductase (DUF899 family)